MQKIIEILKSKRSYIPCRYRPGQVLLYHNHVSPGLFIITKGSIVLSKGKKPVLDVSSLNGDTRVLTAGTSPFMFPLPNKFEEPSKVIVYALKDVDAFFIPRSFLDSKELLQQIDLFQKFAII